MQVNSLPVIHAYYSFQYFQFYCVISIAAAPSNLQALNITNFSTPSVELSWQYSPAVANTSTVVFKYNIHYQQLTFDTQPITEVEFLISTADNKTTYLLKSLGKQLHIIRDVFF